MNKDSLGIFRLREYFSRKDMNKYKIIDILRRTNVLQEYNNIFIECSKGIKYIRQLQKEKLKLLLEETKNNNYYKKDLKYISINTIKNEPYRVLQGLPIIDKQNYKRYYNKIKSNKLFEKSEVQYTGGSTGEPLIFELSKKSLSRMIAFNYYLWTIYLKFKFGNRIFSIGGSSLGGNKGIRKKVYRYLENKRYVKGDWVDRKTLDSTMQCLQKNKYQYVYGYPNSIEFFVNKLLDNGILPVEKIKGIICTSEILHESTAIKLNKYFKALILDNYGARDGGLVSARLFDNSSFHYNMQDCIVESLVCDERIGENELVLTNLNNYKIPFIRYRVGDLGSVDIINDIPSITHFKGRSRDLLFNTKGTLFHGSLFNKVCKKYSWINKFQIIQYNDLAIKINFHTDESQIFTFDDIKKEIKHIIDDYNISITFVLNEPFMFDSSNNKFKTIISLK